MKHLKITASVLLVTGLVHAQHQEHNHNHKPEVKKDTITVTSKKAEQKQVAPKDTVRPKTVMPADNHSNHNHDHGQSQPMNAEHQHDGSPNMSHAFSLNLPMTRNGSGTSWLPDNSPMYGYMFHTPKWMYMVHGSAFIRYNKQDLLDKGTRGDAKFDAPNMVMLMGQRKIGASGLLHFNTMFSLDPLTVGAEGYPLLFQTGESYQGKPLVDRQHPHDLFSELSVSYAHALSKKSDVFVYLGYPGEPALGPAAYVHRPSGFFNPDAPLSHHWIDATHITFGVATVGYRYGNWKIEGSSFTGREPDEERYNFDKPLFNSWSGRLSYNPSAKWALQVSHGFIKEPEALHPGEDVNRTTASATYSSRGFGESFLNITGLWGMNKTAGHSGEHAALLEATRAYRTYTIYGRYEWVQKSLEELDLDESEFGHDAVFPVHAFTAGISKDVLTIGQTKFAIGGQLSFFGPDERLTPLYGQNPLAGQIYLRINPRVMGRQEGKLYLPY